ncbi:MAG: hypothetical protein FJ207_06920 [Gemmatimonadetes bacterium]|nr:hypothetical protein [Gemmatimonadota bacterium]
MNRRTAVAAAATFLALLHLGGVCGSVLRRYDPVDWPTGPSGGYERDFGPLHLTVWGLIRQTGRFDAIAENRGTGPLTVDGVEIRLGDRTERWAPSGSPIVVQPGQEAEIIASFPPPDVRGRIGVIIRTSVQPVELELALP